MWQWKLLWFLSVVPRPGRYLEILSQNSSIQYNSSKSTPERITKVLGAQGFLSGHFPCPTWRSSAQKHQDKSAMCASRYFYLFKYNCADDISEDSVWTVLRLVATIQNLCYPRSHGKRVGAVVAYLTWTCVDFEVAQSKFVSLHAWKWAFPLPGGLC